MRRKIINSFILIILFLAPTSLCNNEDTIKEQKNSFGINSFISNSKKYIGESFLEENDVNQIFETAIKGQVDNKTLLNRLVNLFGKEIKSTLGAISSILAIIVIHSILKSISESLENDNISKLIYYVQYILIATIVMANFSEIIKLTKDSITNMIGFINMLVPILTSLMLFTGSITTTSMLEPTIIFAVNLMGNIIQDIILPIVLVMASFSIISKLSDKVQIDKLAKFLKSSVVWFLGIILTIFVSVISLEGTLSSSVDGVTAKTTKAVVSSAIPIVGKILGDAVDSILGCGIILKNAVGIVGVVIIIGICVVPILKLAMLSITYKALAGVCQPIADTKILQLLEQIGDIFKILLAILSSVAVLTIIGITLVIKISNSGMMYR
ncbi:MAG: stage III sporulation protein AE [Clostridia bacterium]|nr:stage III sporulation protein AE [Clostridia bacterium]